MISEGLLSLGYVGKQNVASVVICEKEGWMKPELMENTNLNQVITNLLPRLKKWKNKIINSFAGRAWI